MNSADDFINMFRNVTGMDNVVYRCVKCGSVVEKIVVKTTMDTPRKLFYCKYKKCVHFGIITVVAKK
jgi:DNA-directed RNA polymerase subunit RPC12/RpoP